MSDLPLVRQPRAQFRARLRALEACEVRARRVHVREDIHLQGGQCMVTERDLLTLYDFVGSAKSPPRFEVPI